MYTLQEAARALGIDRQTLNKRIRLLSIDCIVRDGDRRSKWLTDTDLHRLASGFGRDIASTLDAELESVKRQSEELERRIGELEQIVGLLWDGYEPRQPTGGYDSKIEDILRRIAPNSIDMYEGEQQSSTLSLVMDARKGLRKAIEFIEDVTQETLGQENNILYITFQREDDVFRLAPPLRREWWRTLRGALERQWRIIHLIRLDRNLQRTLGIVEGVIELLGTAGQYEPAYISRDYVYDSPQSQRELIVVPQTAALELSASRPSRYLDKMVVHGPNADCAELQENVEELHLRSKQLFTVYPKISVRFSEAITRAEEQPGNCGLFMNGLSELTIPHDVYDQRVRSLPARSGGERQRVAKLLELHERRQEGFRQQLERSQRRTQQAYSTLHICPMGAIRRYVDTGIVAPDDVLMNLQAIPLSPPQRRKHLRNVIDWLRYYKHYYLGLLDDDKAPQNSFHTFWMVRSNYSVLLETRLGTTKPGEELDIEITEPTVVQAFQEHFAQLWNQLERGNREKQHVIEWLEFQMSRIPAEDPG